MKYNKMITFAMTLALFSLEGKIAKAAEAVTMKGTDCPAAKDVKNALIDKVKNSTKGSFSSGFSGTFDLNTPIPDPKKLNVDKPTIIGENTCKYYVLNGSITDGAAKVQLEGASCPAVKDVKNALADKVKNAKIGKFEMGFSGTFDLNAPIPDPKKLTVDKPTIIGGNTCKYYILDGAKIDGAAKVQLGS